MTPRRLFLGFVLCVCFAAHEARADPTDAAREQAAEHFDAGVRAFQSSAFADAARAFLRADESVPSLVALRNALSAAQRADAPLLIYQSADRLLAQTEVTGSERSAAEEARRQAEARTSVLELYCAAAACAPALDGEVVQPGEHRVLPGPHQLTWEAETRAVDCVAGQRCEAAFEVAALVPAATANAVDEPVAKARTRPRRSRNQRAAFGTMISLGASALIFGGLTLWAGLDALDARDLHERDPQAYDPKDVRRLARRSDLFLGASLLCAAGAGASALWWVDWNPRNRTQLVLLPEGGVALYGSGRF